MVKLYDIQGQIVNQFDLQNKTHWCKAGETMEEAFVRQHGQQLGYAINPEKTVNPYVPDLVNLTMRTLADLKTQNTPFFVAQKNFGIDPTYAVVFNLKDRKRYEELYPTIDILFWIDWVAVRAEIYGKPYKAQSLRGVFKISFQQLLKLLNEAPVHSYQQRANDTKGNAKDSYVLDIRHTLFQRLA